MIKLNGYVYIDGKDMYFEDFEIEIDEELELPFDELDDEDDEYCDGYCEDCDECDEDKADIDIDDIVDMLTDTYVDILNEECLCDECVKKILTEFIREFIDSL